MLTRLYVDNYKCLVNLTVEFKPVSLLLGPNGSGKSSVLQVLAAVRDLLCDKDPVDLDFPAETLCRWETRTLQHFEVEIHREGQRYVYTLELDSEPKKKHRRIVLEELTHNGGPLFRFSEGEVALFRDDYSEGPRFFSDWTRSMLATVPERPENTRLTWFRNYLSSWTCGSLIPASMLSEVQQEEEVLNAVGGNFASWYLGLKLARFDATERHHNYLRQVIPGFKGFDFKPAGKRHILYASFTGGEAQRDQQYRFDELSDGQRALAVLYALIAYSEQDNPQAVMLDEPDNYVALSELQPWLQELTDACEELRLQAIMVSHHPEFYDYLGAECGIWLAREPGGPTRVMPPPDLKEAGLRLSELAARGWVP